MIPPYLYLAGPMRGLPRHGFDAFAAARDGLRTRGHGVWCPAERALHEGFDPDTGAGMRPLADYMRRDLDALCGAWGVVVLPGWQDSHGVRAELAVAWALGTPVMEWPTLRLISMRVVVDCHSSEDELSAIGPAGEANSEAAQTSGASESVTAFTQDTSQIRTRPADFHGIPAVGPLADTSHDGLWRRAAWPGEVTL